MNVQHIQKTPGQIRQHQLGLTFLGQDKTNDLQPTNQAVSRKSLKNNDTNAYNIPLYPSYKNRKLSMHNQDNYQQMEEDVDQKGLQIKSKRNSYQLGRNFFVDEGVEENIRNGLLQNSFIEPDVLHTKRSRSISSSNTDKYYSIQPYLDVDQKWKELSQSIKIKILNSNISQNQVANERSPFQQLSQKTNKNHFQVNQISEKSSLFGAKLKSKRSPNIIREFNASQQIHQKQITPTNNRIPLPQVNHSFMNEKESKESPEVIDIESQQKLSNKAYSSKYNDLRTIQQFSAYGNEQIGEVKIAIENIQNFFDRLSDPDSYDGRTMFKLFIEHFTKWQSRVSKIYKRLNRELWEKDQLNYLSFEKTKKQCLMQAEDLKEVLASAQQVNERYQHKDIQNIVQQLSRMLQMYQTLTDQCLVLQSCREGIDEILLQNSNVQQIEKELTIDGIIDQYLTQINTSLKYKEQVKTHFDLYKGQCIRVNELFTNYTETMERLSSETSNIQLENLSKLHQKYVAVYEQGIFVSKKIKHRIEGDLNDILNKIKRVEEEKAFEYSNTLNQLLKITQNDFHLNVSLAEFNTTYQNCTSLFETLDSFLANGKLAKRLVPIRVALDELVRQFQSFESVFHSPQYPYLSQGLLFLSNANCLEELRETFEFVKQFSKAHGNLLSYLHQLKHRLSTGNNQARDVTVSLIPNDSHQIECAQHYTLNLKDHSIINDFSNLQNTPSASIRTPNQDKTPVHQSDLETKQNYYLLLKNSNRKKILSSKINEKTEILIPSKLKGSDCKFSRVLKLKDKLNQNEEGRFEQHNSCSVPRRQSIASNHCQTQKKKKCISVLSPSVRQIRIQEQFFYDLINESSILVSSQNMDDHTKTEQIVKGINIINNNLKESMVSCLKSIPYPMNDMSTSQSIITDLQHDLRYLESLSQINLLASELQETNPFSLYFKKFKITQDSELLINKLIEIIRQTILSFEKGEEIEIELLISNYSDDFKNMFAFLFVLVMEQSLSMMKIKTAEEILSKTMNRLIEGESYPNISYLEQLISEDFMRSENVYPYLVGQLDCVHPLIILRDKYVNFLGRMGVINRLLFENNSVLPNFDDLAPTLWCLQEIIYSSHGQKWSSQNSNPALIEFNRIMESTQIMLTNSIKNLEEISLRFIDDKIRQSFSRILESIVIALKSIQTIQIIHGKSQISWLESTKPMFNIIRKMGEYLMRKNDNVIVLKESQSKQIVFVCKHNQHDSVSAIDQFQQAQHDYFGIMKNKKTLSHYEDIYIQSLLNYKYFQNPLSNEEDNQFSEPLLNVSYPENQFHRQGAQIMIAHTASVFIHQQSNQEDSSFFSNRFCKLQAIILDTASNNIISIGSLLSEPSILSLSSDTMMCSQSKLKIICQVNHAHESYISDQVNFAGTRSQSHYQDQSYTNKDEVIYVEELCLISFIDCYIFLQNNTLKQGFIRHLKNVDFEYSDLADAEDDLLPTTKKSQPNKNYYHSMLNVIEEENCYTCLSQSNIHKNEFSNQTQLNITENDQFIEEVKEEFEEQIELLKENAYPKGEYREEQAHLTKQKYPCYSTWSQQIESDEVETQQTQFSHRAQVDFKQMSHSIRMRSDNNGSLISNENAKTNGCGEPQISKIQCLKSKNFEKGRNLFYRPQPQNLISKNTTNYTDISGKQRDQDKRYHKDSSGYNERIKEIPIQQNNAIPNLKTVTETKTINPLINLEKIQQNHDEQMQFNEENYKIISQDLDSFYMQKMRDELKNYDDKMIRPIDDLYKTELSEGENELKCNKLTDLSQNNSNLQENNHAQNDQINLISEEIISFQQSQLINTLSNEFIQTQNCSNHIMKNNENEDEDKDQSPKKPQISFSLTKQNTQ